MVTAPRARVSGGPPRCNVEHNWLPLALPAGARRFRVADVSLREVLAAAGAELVEECPDVEIGSEPQGDAPVAIVPIASPLPEGGSRGRRAARRASGYASVRLRAAAVARSLRRRYASVEVLTWDLDRAFGPAALPAGLVESLHCHALVVARHGEHEPTLVGEILGRTGIAARPFVARVIVAAGDRSVARIAVGPAARQIESQRNALDALQRARPPQAIAELVPWVEDYGDSSLATWSVERRLHGTSAGLPLDPGLERECVDVLAALHPLGDPGGGRGSLLRDADTVGDAVPPVRAALRTIAQAAEEALATVPRGYGHGDFWSGNLLVEDGRLSGIVDWDAAGPDRLPLLDLLHLRANGRRVLPPEAWGAVLVHELLPWARAGGDALSRSYLERIGIELDASQLEALVIAYWLDRVAYQVNLYEEIAASPLWLHRNVVEVLEALAPAPVTVVAPPAPVAELEAEWSELALRSRNVFGTPEWARAWWRHFGKGELLVHGARAGDGRLIAVLPIHRWGRGPWRIVRFIGHGPGDRLGPVCDPADRAAAAHALRAALVAERSDLFVGEQLPADEGWAALLGARRLVSSGSPVLRFEGRSWDEYLASRSRNFREQIRRRERSLARDHDLVYRLADDPARLDADLDVLFELHGAHWGPSASPFARQEAFHREFALAAQSRGWLRLWLMEVDGNAVAAWYGFRFAGVECYYQAGRDPAWDRASVGFVLLAHSIRAALEDGAGEYWFLRGNESYKYRFATDDSGLETIALVGSATGRVALAAASRLRQLHPAATAGVYAASQLLDVLRS